MNREEIIEELLERMEEELDELTNAQLEIILNDYKHISLLSGIIEDVELEDDVDDEESGSLDVDNIDDDDEDVYED